jgi:hypothetical protein
MTSKTNLAKDGAAQAALLSAMAGILALALVNLGTEISESFKEKIHGIGKLFIPGAEGIGPYSGKEVMALAAWLASWFVLHLCLRDRELSDRAVVGIFLMGVALATTLLWPPAMHWTLAP